MGDIAYLRLVHIVQDVPDLGIGNTALREDPRRPSVRNFAFVGESETDEQGRNMFYRTPLATLIVRALQCDLRSGKALSEG